MIYEKSYRASKSLIDLSFPPSGDCQSMFFHSFYLCNKKISLVNFFHNKQKKSFTFLFISFPDLTDAKCLMFSMVLKVKKKHRNLYVMFLLFVYIFISIREVYVVVSVKGKLLLYCQ